LSRYRVPDYSSPAFQNAHNRDVGDPALDRYEAALRRLPDAHSLVLRLRDAGVDDEVICQYLQIEREGLETLILLARTKLAAELNK
jgi:DNA-directed RNA polymerase specialized sigma24 family protein